MKANTLLELAGMQIWDREIEQMCYLHIFVYRDEEGNSGGNQWEGKVNKIEKMIASFQRDSKDFQDEVIQHLEGSQNKALENLQRDMSDLKFYMTKIAER